MSGTVKNMQKIRKVIRRVIIVFMLIILSLLFIVERIFNFDSFDRAFVWCFVFVVLAIHFLLLFLAGWRICLHLCSTSAIAPSGKKLQRFVGVVLHPLFLDKK